LASTSTRCLRSCLSCLWSSYILSLLCYFHLNLSHFIPDYTHFFLPLFTLLLSPLPPQPTNPPKKPMPAPRPQVRGPHRVAARDAQEEVRVVGQEFSPHTTPRI
jgi:hypothetical protein